MEFTSSEFLGRYLTILDSLYNEEVDKKETELTVLNDTLTIIHEWLEQTDQYFEFKKYVQREYINAVNQNNPDKIRKYTNVMNYEHIEHTTNFLE